MPPKYQNFSPLQQTPTIPSSYSYTVAMQNDGGGDDDDDICPVCESECTCDKPALPPPPPPTITPSLKIRLTVPPSLLSSLQNQAKTKSLSKTDQTTSDSVPNGGIPIKKKRGRPTKAEAEARRQAAALLESQKKSARIPTPRKRNSLAQTASGKPNDRIRNRTEPKKGRNETCANLSTDSDSEESASMSFPTFVSALSTSGNEDDDYRKVLDSDMSELSSLPDAGDDTSLEEEEERFFIQDEAIAQDKARLKREILRGEGEQRRFGHRKRNSWEMRQSMRAPVLGDNATILADSDSDSDSDTEQEEAEDEDDADADGEADAEVPEDGTSDIITGPMFWSDSEEDFDADVFFASLSDSEASTLGFEHVFEPSHEDEDDLSEEIYSSHLNAISIEDATSASLLPSLSKLGPADVTTVLVTRDWNGQTVFTNGSDLAMGMLDIDFELNVVAQHQAAAQLSEPFPSGGDDDEETWMRSDDDGFMDSDHGDTTDEDITPIRGVQTPSGIVMFRFPTPPISAIDPLSTLSPAPKKNSSTKHHKRFERVKKNLPAAPKPYEILARKGSMLIPEQCEDGNGDDTTSTGRASSSLSSSARLPVLGKFEAATGSHMRHIIINGQNNADIPPPLGKVDRSRRGSGSSRGRKRSQLRNGSPYPFVNRQQGQSPLSGRSLSTDTRTRHSSRPSLELTSLQPITLDDVLDSSLMDSVPMEGVDEQPSSGEVGRFVNRWEHVPMSTYRRTRNTVYVSSDSLEPVMQWDPNQSSSVSDGFCYGSSGRSLLRSGPFFSTLVLPNWQRNINSSASGANTPISIPSRQNDGNTTPTPGSASPALGNTPPEQPIPRILSHKQRRKEKRRHVEQQPVPPNPLPSIVV